MSTLVRRYVEHTMHNGRKHERASVKRKRALEKSRKDDAKRKPMDMVTHAVHIITKGDSTINRIKKRRKRERELLNKGSN